jgi:hypothetical protein
MKIPRLAPGPPLVALAASPQSFISRQWSLRFSGHLQIDSLPTDIARDDKEQYGGVWITPGQTCTLTRTASSSWVTPPLAGDGLPDLSRGGAGRVAEAA